MSLAKQILTILVLAFVSSTISAKLKPIELSPQDRLAVSVHKFKNLSEEKCIVLDVRSVKKFTEGHPSGAIHFDSSQWDESFTKLMEHYTGEETVITYCGSGCGSSKNVVQQLRDAGIEKSFYIHNGYQALEKLGLIVQE